MESSSWRVNKLIGALCEGRFFMDRTGLGKEGLSQILIGSSHVVNSTYDPNQVALYSLDKMRLSLKFAPRYLEQIQTLLDTWSVADDMYGGTSQKLAGYRNWWVYRFDETSINVGIGWNSPGGKVEAGKGYIEFNPNKVGAQAEKLIGKLGSCYVRGVSSRYDLAIDVPIPRDELRVIKDQRVYECVVSDSLTEYLGQRNKPGRVKVYDKQKEAGLSFPLTRIELTCDGSWTTDRVVEQLPLCYAYGNKDFDTLARTTKVIALMGQSIIAAGGVFEPWLKMLNPHTRSKINNALRGEVSVSYSEKCIDEMLGKVKGWEFR